MKTKKLISTLLASIMILSSLPMAQMSGLDFGSWFTKASAAEETMTGTCGNNLTWNYDSTTQKIVVTGTGTDLDSFSDIYKIGDSVKSVVLPDTVTTIESNVFNGWNNLENINLPQNLTSIGDTAFAQCYKLTEVNLPENITEIKPFTFYDCTGLTSISIPENVTKIGNHAFSGCAGLTSVDISENVTSIEKAAFSACTNLKNINVDSENPSYTSDSEGILFSKDMSKLIQYPGGNDNVSYIIPDFVSEIEERAFASCANLQEVTIPENVTSIGYDAFLMCEALHTVNFNVTNSSLPRIFSGCNNLTTINIGNNVKLISGFSNSCITSINIPGNVTAIDSYAFENCKNLTNINISEGVTVIESKAFWECTGLKSIVIPDSITTIGDNAFYYCTALETVSLPESITTIGNYAFSNCSALTSINIPDTVTEMGSGVFSGCTGLKSISGYPSVISNSMFSGCSGLTSLNIPEGTTEIGDSAFSLCVNLKEVSLPDGLETIGRNSFKECNKIEEIIFPSSVKLIGINAFTLCTSLEKIGFETPLINDLVIKEGAFHACYNLKEIGLPEGLTTIGGNCFSNCLSLESIIIPSTVTYLGDYCFYEDGSLETVEFKENSKLLTLGSGSGFGPFARCYNLKTITLPQSVESINFGTFAGCTALESFNIPENTKRIVAPLEENSGGGGYGALLSLKEISVDPENETFRLDENGSLYTKDINGNSSLIAAPNKEGMKTLKILPYKSFNILLYRYVTNIDKIEVADGVDGYTTDENGVLYNADKTKLLKYPAGKTETEFMIPASVTSIDMYAFFGAENLRSFTVENGNTAFTVEDGVLYTADKTTIVAYPLGKTSKEFEFISTVNNFSLINFMFAKHIEKFSVADGNTLLESDENGVVYLNDYGRKYLCLYPCGREATEYTVNNNIYGIYIDAFYNSPVEELNIHDPFGMVTTSYFMIKKFQCINYEGESLFDEVKQANRLLAASTFNNSAEITPQPEDETKPVTGTDSATKVTYSYQNGSFDYNGNIDFEVIPKSKDDYADAFRGYADECDDIFFYKIKFYAVDENNNSIKEVQPNNGKKVKIGFPIPKDYKNADPALFMVLHKRSDNGILEFFKPSNNNIEIKNGYVYIWADNFSPFALVINYTGIERTVSSISIASLPAKTSYTYKSDNLDISGLALTVMYSDGTKETVTNTSTMKVTGFDNSKIGTQTVTVEYEGASTTFNVTVSYAWWQWIIRILLLGFLWY